MRTGNFSAYTTRVETPLTVWQDISKGIYSGAQAIMDGKYKALGDLLTINPLIGGIAGLCAAVMMHFANLK